MAAKTLLNRWEAAAALGISHATLRRWENVKITPALTELGEHVFRRTDVDALAEAIRSGAIQGVLGKNVTAAQKSARIKRETERRERLEELEARRLRVSVKVLRARKLRALSERGPLLRGGRIMTAKLLAEIRESLASGERHLAIAERVGVTRPFVSAISSGKHWRNR